MPFSEIELKRIEKIIGDFCKGKSPAHLKDKLSFHYSVKNFDILIYERRPRWNDPSERTESGVAKLRYIRKTNRWHLYWQRANLKWVKYEPYFSSSRLSQLVAEIDKDPYGCFFG